MATKISIESTKGGVGKGTLTANLGALLLVDADIQPTLSSYYRLADQAPRGLVDVLETGGYDRWDQRNHRRMRHHRLERSRWEESMLNVIRELLIGIEEAVLARSDVPRSAKP